MMRTEIQQDSDPIFHESYMLMSSYVTDVAMKVELYLNNDKITKIEHKSTKLYGEIYMNLKDIMKNHRSKMPPLRVPIINKVD